MEVLHLPRLRIRFAVGREKTVAIEVVVGRVVVVIVATIGIGRHSLIERFAAQALVYEVPDESALILRVLPYQLPILLEAAAGVAHSVAVLTLDEGALLGLV